jgi:hypothetical protein
MILIRLIRRCKKKKGVEQEVLLILCLLVLVSCQLYLIGLNGASEEKIGDQVVPSITCEFLALATCQLYWTGLMVG